MPSKIKKRGAHSYLLTVTAGYDGQGKQITHTKTVKATSPHEAEKLYGLFLAEIEKGQIATSGKMTLDQFFDYWLKNYAENQHAPKTISYNKGLFKRISQAIGHKRLDQIGPKHLLAFYKNLSESGVRQYPNEGRRKARSAPGAIDDKSDKTKKDTLSPNTIRKYHILLHSLFEKATKWQFTAYNPATKVEPPKAERHPKAIYDEETIGRFLVCWKRKKLSTV